MAENSNDPILTANELTQTDFNALKETEKLTFHSDDLDGKKYTIAMLMPRVQTIVEGNIKQDPRFEKLSDIRTDARNIKINDLLKKCSLYDVKYTIGRIKTLRSLTNQIKQLLAEQEIVLDNFKKEVIDFIADILDKAPYQKEDKFDHLNEIRKKLQSDDNVWSNTNNCFDRIYSAWNHTTYSRY